ncbi:MAG: tetraacyldisaccharide 4'-kinase [Armatimonadetes bacterium]|nr:tetraacyldisaccharide 4'-kinase [Armatimonadota bacterium]
MSGPLKHWADRWESTKWNDRLFRGALVPLSWLYAGGWQSYLAIYRFGLKKAHRHPFPVICVGNLLVGGTGKSPFVLYLAELLQSMDHAVVLSCSGYGSPASESATLAPDGPLNARDWGDEPAMIRWLAPSLPLIVGRHRVTAAKRAEAHFPGAILLMDDGMQHLPLAKDLIIALDTKLPRNRFCLPAGPYREPRRNRKRADLVVPGEFKVVADEPVVVSPEGEVILPGEAQVLCALGQPKRFLKSLTKSGWTVLESKLLPDHDPMTSDDLWDGLRADLPIVVTPKDWVKLRERSDLAGRRIGIVRHRVHVEPEDRFRDWLREKLNGLQK